LALLLCVCIHGVASVNRLRLIVLLHAVIAALFSMQMQQQQALAAKAFAAMYVRRIRVEKLGLRAAGLSGSWESLTLFLTQIVAIYA
jgi:hypothetical protein